MSDDWNDDLESTRVSDIDKLREELTRRTQRDRAYLIVLAGTDVGKMFKLDEGETVIGRSHRADIRIDDDSISRMHVKLSLDGTSVCIEDLNSSNGTLVNGAKIDTEQLRDGDEELRPRDDYEAARLGRLREVRRELGDVILNRLAKLPRRIRQPLGHDRQLLLVHGSPLDPMEPITHDMDDVTVSHLLADDPADVVLCGGSHVPFDRVVARQGDDVPSHTRVINLGSVGEAPAGEGVGGPTQTTNWAPLFAHATFVESKDGGIDVEQFVVPLGRAA